MRASGLRKVAWLLFALMWIPFVGIFVALTGIPEGGHTWGDLPPLMRHSIVATFGLMVLSMATFLLAAVVGAVANARTLARGEKAEAVVLDLRDTGTTLNEQPVVALRLQVHPATGAGFEAEAEGCIPRLKVPQVQPGARVPVRFDPRSKAVALDL